MMMKSVAMESDVVGLRSLSRGDTRRIFAKYHEIWCRGSSGASVSFYSIASPIELINNLIQALSSHLAQHVKRYEDTASKEYIMLPDRRIHGAGYDNFGVVRQQVAAHPYCVVTKDQVPHAVAGILADHGETADVHHHLHQANSGMTLAHSGRDLGRVQSRKSTSRKRADNAMMVPTVVVPTQEIEDSRLLSVFSSAKHQQESA